MIHRAFFSIPQTPEDMAINRRVYGRMGNWSTEINHGADNTADSTTARGADIRERASSITGARIGFVTCAKYR